MQKTRKRKTTIPKDKTYQYFNATVFPTSYNILTHLNF